MRLLRAAGRRLIAIPFAVAAALYLLFEEYLLVRVRAVIERLERIDLVTRVEAKVAVLPPYPALVLFAIPGLVLYPLKALSLWLLAGGHVIAGIALFAFTEIIGTVALAWLFKLCRPALMTLPWFRVPYVFVLRLRDALFAYVRALPAWQAAGAVIARLRAALTPHLRALRDAIRPLVRRLGRRS